MSRTNESEPNSLFAQRDVASPDQRTIGGSVATTSDVDFLSYWSLPTNASSGGAATFDALLRGGFTGGGTLYDGMLALLNESGGMIQYNDDSAGYDARLVGSIASNGRLNFAVTSYADFDFNGGGRYTGTYNLELQVFITGTGSGNTLRGTAWAESVQGGGGGDVIYGGGGDDQIWGYLRTGPGGADGADRIYCEAGNDYAIGHNGNDLVDGGSGNDDLYGDTGNDTIIGGLGKDTMGGGAGNDIFRFNSVSESSVGTNRDIVFFKLPGAALEDRIDLSAVYSGTLAWKGTGALAGASVRVLNGPSNQTIVQVSNDADNAVEMEIALADDSYTAAHYVAADFIL
ncbi:MAG: hypothetical protein P9C48_06385 [Defluviicoccus sp.]|nr:hypothetical protein [Defluviicoccus sp.]MDG4608742.1 hypothetical protein [Defluviicoccus sp.]